MSAGVPNSNSFYFFRSSDTTVYRRLRLAFNAPLSPTDVRFSDRERFGFSLNIWMSPPSVDPPGGSEPSDRFLYQLTSSSDDTYGSYFFALPNRSVAIRSRNRQNLGFVFDPETNRRFLSDASVPWSYSVACLLQERALEIRQANDRTPVTGLEFRLIGKYSSTDASILPLRES